MRALARAGEWIYLRTLSGVSSYTYTHGTAKTESSTETDSWSDSVTKTVSASLKVNLPFGDIGGGVSVATTTATEQSKTYSSEWSMSTEESLEITYDASYEGKALWQWQFFIGDTYGNSLNTKVQNYALTSGTYEPPRCYPGGPSMTESPTKCRTRVAMTTSTRSRSIFPSLARWWGPGPVVRK